MKSKSNLIKKIVKQKAKKEGKFLVDWKDLSEKQKKTILKNKKDYSVIIDVKLSKFDNDIKGLPDISKMEWKDERSFFKKLFDKVNLK
jgi:hypothetical protein